MLSIQIKDEIKGCQNTIASLVRRACRCHVPEWWFDCRLSLFAAHCGSGGVATHLTRLLQIEFRANAEGMQKEMLESAADDLEDVSHCT